MLGEDREHRWADGLAQEAQAYVRQVLDLPLTLRVAPSLSNLPYFLADRYVLLEGDLLGAPCVFMAAQAAYLETPAVVAKHWRQVRDSVEQPVILLVDAVSAHNRARLIEQRVPFVVPGNQLYLPEFGLDLREHFRTARRTEVDHLSPTAQLVLLDELLHPSPVGKSRVWVAKRFQCSPMSAGRAVEELSAARLGELYAAGPQKQFRFYATGRNLWEAAYPRLQSPVRKTRRIVQAPPNFTGYLAGESALAEYEMLSAPATPVYAVTAADWRTLERMFGLVETEDEGQLMLQTWAYDPGLLTDRSGPVDPFSLYLSLAGETDERITMSADRILERYLP